MQYPAEIPTAIKVTPTYKTPGRRTGSALLYAAIAGLLLGTTSGPAPLAQGLPELSDSAALIMNNDQEKIFGKQVMLNVRARSTFSDDALLQEYFTTLSQRLAQKSPRDFGMLTVALAVDPDINAFAVPGGYITINTGLIQNTDSEDELASVIAHEIGHESQRHIARSIERSKQLTLPATAAMIGGILLGGQAVLATIVASQGAVASDRLSFSRTFEREADATGINILAAAGYDPNAMPRFFNNLEKQSRLYGGTPIPFLSTHPVTSDRIADGRSRAARLKQAKAPPPPPPDRLNYAYAKARTLALYDKPLNAVITRFEHILNNPQAEPEAQQVAGYGLSIAYLRNDEPEKSARVLQVLRDKNPDNPLYRLEQAELAAKNSDTAIAVKLYSELYTRDPSNPAYIEGYVRALTRNGDYPKAIRMLRKTIRHQPQYAWTYGLLAKAYADDGKILNAIFIRAQQLDNAGLYGQALALLHQQKRQSYPDSSEYLSASMGSLIASIEEKKRQLDNFKL